MTQPVPIRRVPDQALRAVALCAGYGGLEAALGAGIGAVPVAYAENDPYAAKVFAAHHPGIPNLGDITRIDWDQVRALHRPDVIGAGFPCRNISNAGRKDGINGQWSKVWKNVAQAVGVIRPRYVFLENVAALRSRGLDVVAADLAAIGYDVRWTCLRAGDPEVGAPHQRDRWFAVAHPADADPHDLRRHWRPRHLPQAQGWIEPADRGDAATARLRLLPTPKASDGPHGGPNQRDTSGRYYLPGQAVRLDPAWVASDGTDYGPAIRRWEHITGRQAPCPTEPGTRGNRRLSPAFAEWLMGLPAGWVTAVPDIPRKEQLRVIGNGVVPQQAAYAYAQLLGVVPAAWNTPLEVAA
ncbi:DNA cytosine methyltransferase [Streptomyces sp. NBC_01762]|uniref:DNA cytosine methyltransferase n=1 Tax=unclassified Streptomyces TaxID=2593676 RepID=UPI002DDBF786|nr:MULTISPECIES: DNA cytosine methyltransferase [unclassified Streptomyces]WSC44965.1 DNA cytosine methyltransferase [Streptomyces sp. NBC_01762]WSD24625.1 DNA cytosine methyltransferase [Streptomyces sp. NBC_01751]